MCSCEYFLLFETLLSGLVSAALLPSAVVQPGEQTQKHSIAEPQNRRGWEGPLGFIKSNSPAKVCSMGCSTTLAQF